MNKLVPCLWLDDQAEEAAAFYQKVFKSARVRGIVRYGKAGQEVTGKKPGSVMTVDLELEGQHFVLLNGGPQFKFSEAISFIVQCKDQKEVDRYWAKLTEGGEPGPCGWLKDRYGVSWQIVPRDLRKLMAGKDAQGGARAMNAMLKMTKLDIAALKRAYKGK